MENTPQTPPKKFTSLSFLPFPHYLWSLQPKASPVPDSSACTCVFTAPPLCWLCLFSPEIGFRGCFMHKGIDFNPGRFFSFFFFRLPLFLSSGNTVRGEMVRKVAGGEGRGGEWPPHLDSVFCSCFFFTIIQIRLSYNQKDALHISSFILCLLFWERWKQKDGCVMLWDLLVGFLIGDDWVAPLGYALHPMKWPPSLYSSPE